MSSNKRAKELLIQRYGEIDFMVALHVVQPQSRTYKSKGQKKRMQQLTYHHIRMKSKGGKATVENGALLTAENHAMFHKLPKVEQDKLNEMFQEYKRQKDRELKVEIVEPSEMPFEISVAEISIDKENRIRAHNRARVKAETRKIIQEYIGEDRENEEI